MRASLPTIASAETTRSVNTRPQNNQSTTNVAAPKLPAGTIHSGGRVPKVAVAPTPAAIKMTPTHDFSTGMAGVHVKHAS
jgi:hypothetical protein